MGMFDNYTPENLEKHVADNYYQMLPQDDVYSIDAGVSVMHVFRLPVKFKEKFIESVEVVYKQHRRLMLSKTPRVYPIDDMKCALIIVDLSPEETAQFDGTLLDTIVQVFVTLKNGEIICDEPKKVIVRNTALVGGEAAEEEE